MKNNSESQRLAWLLASLSVGSAHLPATAAEGVQAAEPAGLEEITVTARRREERLQDVPISVSAFTETALREARIQNVKDVASRVPNFSIVEAQQPGVAFINVRGVGQARNGEPPVAMVIDGVETTNPAQITQNLFDLESIQVLKGPQGAVYGRNAIGGAIIVTTRRPSNELSGALEIGAGSSSDERASGYLSGSLVPDKLLFRVSAAWRDFDGDIDSVNTPGHPRANPDRNTDVRLKLLGNISSNATVDLRYSRLDQTAGAAWYAPVTPGASIDTPLPYVGAIPGMATRKLDDASIKFDVDFSKLRLTSISAYSKIETSIHESLNYTPIDGLSARQSQSTDTVSQELRLSSLGEDAFKWLAGVYFLHSRLPQDTTVYLDPGYFPLFGIPPSVTEPIPMSQARVTNTQNAYAAFGQVSYRYASGWEIAAALRADVDDRDQLDRASPGAPTYSKRFSAVQPKLDLSYHFSPNTMAYGSIGEGFRSGGFNATARITRVYDAEKNWSAETGIKTSLAENRVNLSAALYYTRVIDRQIFVLDVTDSAQTIANPVPRAQIYGAEFDVLARPVPQLDLGFSVGLADSKVLRYDSSVFAGLPVQGDLTGNKLPQTPGYSYSASAQYRFTLPNSLSIVPRLEVNGSGGDYYWELDNKNKRGAVNLVNARLSVNWQSFSLTGYADNLFDEKYVLEYVPAAWSGAATDMSAAAPGRRVGVALRYDF